MLIDLGNVDWTMLSQQKEKLISMISGMDEPHLLDGLVNFLDHIQDSAVKNGIEESIVFPSCSTVESA